MQAAIESILAYFFMWKGLASPDPAQPSELREEVRAWINLPIVKGPDAPDITFNGEGI